MKYIKSNQLIDEVKNTLSSWFNSNKLDESILYSRIRYCLSKFRYETYPYKTTTLVVENYKATLPEDLINLNLALLCYQEEAQNPLERYEDIVNTRDWVEAIDWGNTHVNDVMDLHKDGKDTIEKIVVSYNDFPALIYNRFSPLTLSQKSDSCTKTCLNSQGSTQSGAMVRNGELHTNQETGLVYIEYYSELEDDGVYLIPDHPRVTEWIKSDMIYECFKYLYLNGETDILQRMQLTKQETNIMFHDAMGLIKTSEVHEYYALTDRLQARYTRAANNIYNEKLYPTRYGQDYHNKRR